MAEIKYVDWDGLVYYHGKVTELINDKLEEVIKVGGDVTFAELPDPSFQNLNYIYKVTDKFVVPNNGRFDETLGLECPANTVLRVTNVEDTYLYTIFYKPTSETGNYDLDELLRRVDSLEESIEENSSKVGQLESELTSAQNEIDNLVGTVESIADEVAAFDPTAYAKADAFTELQSKVESIDFDSFATKEEIPTVDVDKAYVDSELAKKQDTLVSGITIKTINGQDITGEGNLVIEGTVDTTQYYTKNEVDSLTKYTKDDGQEVNVVSEVKTLTKAVENLANGSITYDTW